MNDYLIRIEVDDERGRTLASDAWDIPQLSREDARALVSRLQTHIDDELKAMKEARGD